MFFTEMMKTDLVAVTPETKISEAKALMEKANFRHLPVVDAGGKLVGIVTDRDMRDAHPSSLLDEESYQKTLDKVMQHTIAEIMTKSIRRGAFTKGGLRWKGPTSTPYERRNVGPSRFVWTHPAEVAWQREARALAKLLTVKGRDQVLGSRH